MDVLLTPGRHRARGLLQEHLAPVGETVTTVCLWYTRPRMIKELELNMVVCAAPPAGRDKDAFVYEVLKIACRGRL